MFASGPIMSSSSVVVSGFGIQLSNTSTSATPTSTPALAGITAGALLVISSAIGDDSSLATNVIISGTGLTWTKQIETVGPDVHSGSSEIWTAPCPAGGSISASVAWQGGTTLASSSVMYAVTGTEAVPGGTSNFGVVQGQPSVAVTTTRINSILFCVSSDWNSINTAPTYRDSAVQVLLDNTHVANYVAYHYYKITTGIALYTEGLTAPAGQSSGTCVYEIRTP